MTFLLLIIVAIGAVSTIEASKSSHVVDASRPHFYKVPVRGDKRRGPLTDAFGCADHEHYGLCEHWAEYGECETNPFWMLNECRFSCGICAALIAVGPPCGHDLNVTLDFEALPLPVPDVEIDIPRTNTAPSPRPGGYGGGGRRRKPDVKEFISGFGPVKHAGSNFREKRQIDEDVCVYGGTTLDAVANVLITEVPTFSDCLALCQVEVEFTCRSAAFFGSNGNCWLFDTDSGDEDLIVTQPAEDATFVELDDCPGVSGPPLRDSATGDEICVDKQSGFILAALGSVAVPGVSTARECEEACVENRIIECRAAIFYRGLPLCSHLPVNAFDEPDLVEKQGRDPALGEAELISIRRGDECDEDFPIGSKPSKGKVTSVTGAQEGESAKLCPGEEIEGKILFGGPFDILKLDNLEDCYQACIDNDHSSILECKAVVFYADSEECLMYDQKTLDNPDRILENPDADADTSSIVELVVCPPVVNPCPCVDNSTNCVHWAAQGECTRNPLWMVQHCRQACQLCPYLKALEDALNEEETE